MYISLYVMANSHSKSVCWFSAARVCACIDTVLVCTGYSFLQYMYVFCSTGYGLPSACVFWQFSQYVCVLVMFSHSTCVCWQFCSTYVWSRTVHVCASSYAVCGCTSYGFSWDLIYCSMTVQLVMIPAFPQLPSVTQNMFVMRHTVT